LLLALVVPVFAAASLLSRRRERNRSSRGASSNVNGDTSGDIGS
jgi:hypothetical protein